MSIFDMMKSIFSGPLEELACEEVEGLDVSTTLTRDMGWETAILDENGTYPVERYASREDAERGHAAWLVRAQTLQTVQKLGYGDLIPEEQVTLVRRREKDAL